MDAEIDLQAVRANQFQLIKFEKSNTDVKNLNQELEDMKYKNHKISHRKDGRWMARYRHQGKQYSVYGKTQLDCYNNLKYALEHLDSKTHELKHTITFQGWINKWLNMYKVGEIKNTSLQNIKSIINNHLADLLPKKLQSIKTIHLMETISNGKTQKIKQSIYTVLVDLFDKACKNQIIKINPMVNINKPKYTANETKAFTVEEEKAFVETAMARRYYTLLLCLYEGLRIGEAIALTQEDIHEHTISITKSKNKNSETTTPKSKTSIREIPIFARCKKLLQVYTPTTSSTKTEILHFHTIMDDLGYTGFSTRSLRHTFATRAMEAGIEPKVVQKWLGHSSVDITMKIYTHIKEVFENTSANKLNSYFEDK